MDLGTLILETLLLIYTCDYLVMKPLQLIQGIIHS